MGAVSSTFINLVIRVCWACRLYLEQFDRSVLSPHDATSGFLHTPEATSTPFSPAPAPTPSPSPSDPQGMSRALVPPGAGRARRASQPGAKRVKRHSASEILSPIEEEMIRVVMAKGCASLRIGMTPSLRRREAVRWYGRRIEGRGVVLSPGQPCVSLVRPGYQEDYRNRGLRL